MAKTKMKAVLMYLEPRQQKALRALSTRTRVTASAYLREAVDMLLAKYGDTVDALMPPVRTARKRRRKS
jgi:predicted DNA-binding protein